VRRWRETVDGAGRRRATEVHQEEDETSGTSRAAPAHTVDPRGITFLRELSTARESYAKLAEQESQE
jgi:hypothetical protein